MVQRPTQHSLGHFGDGSKTLKTVGSPDDEGASVYITEGAIV